MRKGRCRHFTGMSGPECDAGVLYENVFTSAGNLCCTNGGAGCLLYDEPTEAEIQQWNRETEELIRKSEERDRKLRPLLDRVRKKYRGRDMHGHATCPICGQKGKLTISHVGRNGHLHVFCETEDCVRFME